MIFIYLASFFKKRKKCLKINSLKGKACKSVSSYQAHSLKFCLRCFKTFGVFPHLQMNNSRTYNLKWKSGFCCSVSNLLSSPIHFHSEVDFQLANLMPLYTVSALSRMFINTLAVLCFSSMLLITDNVLHPSYCF